MHSLSRVSVLLCVVAAAVVVCCCLLLFVVGLVGLVGLVADLAGLAGLADFFSFLPEEPFATTTSTHRCPTYIQYQDFGKSPSNMGPRKIYLQRAHTLQIANTTPTQMLHVSMEQKGIYALVALSGMIVFHRSAAHAWTTKSSFVFLLL
jgi:hypothetical protein